MKKFNLAILFFAISSMMLLVYYGCKKDDDNNEEIIYGDFQTEEQNLIIDSCSVSTPPMDSILDIHGVPYGNYKGLFEDGTVDKLVHELVAFTNAKCKEKYETFHNEAQPEHFGYAYSYGQRNMNARLFPPAIDDPKWTAEQRKSNELHRTEAVWGTDCSGLLINAIKYAGIPIETCCSIDLPANLSFALALTDEYKDIIVEDKGQLSIFQIKTGDIVLWPNVPHIGIVGESLKNDVIVFQSNGTCFPENLSKQTTNWLSETRGVHPFSLIKMLTMKKGWKLPYEVYRFKEKDTITTPAGFTFTTKSVSNITVNSAQSGGDITFSSQVAPDISARGVCWSINTNPTINDYKTNNGSGTGSFSSDISGLASATTYYVRAYAQSEGVTYFGNQLSFQTSESGGEQNSIITVTFDGTTVTYDLVQAMIFSNQIIIRYNNPEKWLTISGGPWEIESYNLNSPACSGDDLGTILLEHLGTPFIRYENSWMESCPSTIWPGHYVLMNKDNGNLTITSYDSTIVNQGGVNWKIFMIEGTFGAIMVDKSEVYPDYNFKSVSGSFLLYEWRPSVSGKLNHENIFSKTKDDVFKRK